MINKTVLNEVKQNWRNLVTVWLDYQKTFDSVPHEWLIESLKLAKLPRLIVNITHLFFVNNLKLFAPNMNSMKLLLDFVTAFSKDIGMIRGESKCAYLQIERGR